MTYKELDVQDRLDTLQTEFEILAGKSMSRDVDKFARASAMALISCAIDSLTAAMHVDQLEAEQNACANAKAKGYADLRGASGAADGGATGGGR